MQYPDKNEELRSGSGDYRLVILFQYYFLRRIMKWIMIEDK